MKWNIQGGSGGEKENGEETVGSRHV